MQNSLSVLSDSPRSVKLPVVILAGGKGARLAKVSGGLPKTLVEVAGKPVLEWLLELASSHQAYKAQILAGYRAEAIQGWVASRWHGMPVQVFVESEPLGTAGSLLSCLPDLPDRFIVLYGDTIANVDLTRMAHEHYRCNADVTLYVHPNNHPHDSDLVETDEEGWVTAVHGYPHPEGFERRNLVNAAVFIIEKATLTPHASLVQKSDLTKDLIPQLLQSGARIRGYRGYDYVKDMGTPERRLQVEQDLLSGVLDRKRGTLPRMTVFLDRDGTINADVGHLRHPDQVRLLPGVAGAIRRLNQSGVPVAVLTNQPVIARGEATLAALSRIHARIDFLLGREGAFIDEWFFCPHHPDRGFSGEIPELKMICECRKPATGLYRMACGTMPVDGARSWMVGDTTTDMEMARRAGLHSILLQTGAQGLDGKYTVVPEHVASSLKSAVEIILRAD